jgi:hypothetical protein
MSAAPYSGGRTRTRLRLPGWLAPRDDERRGRGEQRLIETFALVLVGIVLAVATVHDVARQVHIGTRLTADLKSWEAVVGSRYFLEAGKYHNPLIEQDVKTYTTRDIVCANTAEGKPEGHVQVCLVFTGPVHGERRHARGGYYVVAEGKDEHKPVINLPRYSYGCFGSAVAEGLCARTTLPPEAVVFDGPLDLSRT